MIAAARIISARGWFWLAATALCIAFYSWAFGLLL